MYIHIHTCSIHINIYMIICIIPYIIHACLSLRAPGCVSEGRDLMPFAKRPMC